jgi:hypothetical protein
MKLPDFLAFKPFNDLRRQMGTDELGEFSLSLNWEEISLEEVAKLQKEGIDVELDDIKFLNDGSIAYKNRRVLLYIRDWRQHGRYESYPKFHITNCQTLEEMTARGRFQRYVVSTRTDGIFNYNLIDSNRLKTEKEGELDVCKNCLKALNYNNYRDEITREERTKAFKMFDLDEFFIRFTCSPIQITPLETNRTAPLSVYPSDWNEKSAGFKKNANWTCEKCNTSFKGKKPKFLHSHHKNGNIYDNRPSNIEVLCIRCHSKEPYHGFMKESRHYKEYMGLAN